MSTLILCATARLAQSLRAVPPAGAGATWRTPWTATPGQWFGELAEILLLEGIELPQALDGEAERLLWERIVRNRLDEDSAPLFDVEGMAASAQDAHALLRAWCLDLPRQAFASDEVKLFIDWRERFQRRCQAAGWLDAAGLQTRLLELLAAGHGHLPEEVLFAGFDRLTPLEKRLQAVLEGRGTRVGFLPFPAVDRQSLRAHQLLDARAECAAAAAWAGATLARQPEARLAIVVPDLEARRATLTRLLDEALHPETLHPALADRPRRYNVSLGTPLAEVPLVRSALELLALTVNRGRVEQARFGRLLLDGAWSAERSEADGRARLEARLRETLGLNVSLAQVSRQAEASGLCPRSAATLTALLAAQSELSRKPAPPSAWAGEFRRLLELAGWPGERSLSSDEYQARQALLLEIDRLGRLDAVLGAVPPAEALRRLMRIVRERLFQPQTRGTPSVQVLGVLESAGLAFDGLWVMGLNDDLWPPAPAPNPLLPAEFQRQHGTPRASAAVELAFARQVQARLLVAAPEVRVSWAERDGNRERRRSPLLGELAPEDFDLPLPAGPHAALLGGTTACELLDDAWAPPVGADEVLHGGAGLLRAQAVCPAWAFYAHRLHARALGTPVEGFDAAARGTLVHAALEALWTRLGDSAALAALNEAQEAALLAEAAEEALQRFEKETSQPLPRGFRSLEAARLVRLLAAWLPLERARGEPFALYACEREATMALGPLQLRTRADRIDRLADGRLVVLDYKTGSRIDLAGWTGERLFEPQLPLYATHAVPDEVMAGTVFARVLVDQPGFVGLSAESGLLPGVLAPGEGRQKLFQEAGLDNWEAVLAHWRGRLDAIAGEIADGFAGVMVADAERLAWCEVLPLLRLPEWTAQLAAAGATEDAA